MASPPHERHDAQQRMLGAVPGQPALGRGPTPGSDYSRHEYHHPAAGWGAARSVGKVLERAGEPMEGFRALFVMNQEDGGFDCPGCAWPDDPHGLHLDICENGVKHATWELAPANADREFFAGHTVAELAEWSDYDLEAVGRLAEPMSYNPATDKYEPISWDDAFVLVGGTLRELETPDQAAFYTSGRLSNEATFLYQLWVREFGTNNLPDCSNMCHEASGRALTAAIGSGKGTVDLHDWEIADAIWLMADNAATNAPRMLTWLAEADRRGAQLVHINPLIEAGSRRTIIPHEFAHLATFHATSTGTMNVQVRIGGDLALLRGVAKAVFEAAAQDPDVLDHEFIAQYTHGVDEYRALVEATPWADLVRDAGVDEAGVRRLADSYLATKRVIIAWCLGLTQHEHGVDTVREVVNLLLLRGNLGRPGAGPCPVRGHSNVQGNRTCGINNRPDQPFLDRLAEVCEIDPPREAGLGTVGTIEAMQSGDVKVFVALGGNFALASPDLPYTFEALRKCELTVQVSTKLNRSHIVHGKRALILPCLGRTDKDVQAGGVQGITVEDSMSMVHISYGMKDPGSPQLRSECAILAGLAQATLPESRTPWQSYADDYDRIRDTMAQVLPGFEDFNTRARGPHGFRIHQPARERDFRTPSGRVEFSLASLPDDVDPGEGRLTLATVRSHDQFNTTIYSNDDRYRGLKGLRTVVFMNENDLRDRGLEEFDLVDITSFSKDGTKRTVHGYRAVRYEIPPGCTAGYMPELNVLCGIADYSTQSDQPVTKHLVVEVTRSREVRPID
ncbi:molybdopterin-dependent oxidoreductase alpha subunit [Kribbella orskensis]|uniref:Molybdopterin-dependent oxidoreductase alpha subunit n=2 Tax=Kribbellaceae TaxID=2726069 RepID=A0ABY2BNM6_9ACTN|nr:molybdopterin-dependent oxidoreductase alpha subunit [Kribbella sp. VKM Ac-2500]TCO26020.1 molybdopterin-dependent oxidoreductase alpha subunit [Kribbella orskensis]